MEYRLEKKQEQDTLKAQVRTLQEEIARLRTEPTNIERVDVLNGLPPDSVVQFLKRSAAIVIVKVGKLT
jgi:hypothetical protein